MKTLYDEDYYEKGVESGKSCYSNYRWIPELTIPMAARMIEYLGIKENDTILDYGCAKGYCVKAFRLLHREAYGYDISEYALASAPKDVADFLFSELKGEYDWIISKDVFEHIPYTEIDGLLKELRVRGHKMFVIVPLGGEDGKYVIPAYELDKTHVIRENLEWWCQKFEQNGFVVKSAEYLVKYIKENWAQFKKGNGFFVLN